MTDRMKDLAVISVVVVLFLFIVTVVILVSGL
jgi:hypothetical protein